MPNTELTLDRIREEILTVLGVSSVHVELVKRDLDTCIAQTTRVYNRYRPLRGRAKISASAGQKKYLIEHPQLVGVTDVSFIEEGPSMPNIFDPTSYGYTGAQVGLGGISWGEMSQIRTYNEEARKISGTENEWMPYPDPEDGKYYLFLDIPRVSIGNILVSYEYTWTVTPDDEVRTGLKNIPADDVQWFMDYATCRAKQILGRIRGKFGGIVGPDNASNQIDWESLMSEGREDEARLTDDVKKKRRPLPPVIG